MARRAFAVGQLVCVKSSLSEWHNQLCVVLETGEPFMLLRRLGDGKEGRIHHFIVEQPREQTDG